MAASIKKKKSLIKKKKSRKDKWDELEEKEDIKTMLPTEISHKIIRISSFFNSLTTEKKVEFLDEVLGLDTNLLVKYVLTKIENAMDNHESTYHD